MQPQAPNQAMSTDQAIANMVQSFDQGQPADMFTQAPQYQPAAQQPVYQQPQMQPGPQMPQQPMQLQPQSPGGQPSVVQFLPETAPQQPQQPVYQQPQIPGQMPQQPQVPQLPQGPQPAYSYITPPPVQIPGQPGQQQQQPAWAQELIQNVQQLQQQPGQQQPGGQQPAVQPGQGDTWSDTRRPTSWTEMQQAIQAEAQRVSQQTLNQWQQQQNQTQQQTQAEMDAAQTAIDQTEMQLRQYGYLPQIANPMDPNDAGIMATRELESFAIANNSNNLFAAATTLKALHDTGMFFDVYQKRLIRRGSQTVAAQAPIAGASPSISPIVSQQGPTYGQMAGMSIDQLVNAGMNNIQ